MNVQVSVSRRRKFTECEDMKEEESNAEYKYRIAPPIIYPAMCSEGRDVDKATTSVLTTDHTTTCNEYLVTEASSVPLTIDDGSIESKISATGSG